MPMLIRPAAPLARRRSSARSPWLSPPPTNTSISLEAMRAASLFRPVTAMIRVTPGSHAPGGPLRIGPGQLAIAGQRPQREEFRIAVVAQVEDPRKATAGIVLLAPQPVRLLALDQPAHAGRDRWAVDLAGRHEAC